MKNQFILTILLWLFVLTANAQTNYEKQIRDITQELSKKIGETDKKRVAVADFTDLDGSVTKLGRFIAEEFNTYLPEAGQGLEVIDRSRINLLIKENQMLRKGLTDPSAAAKLGQLAGINALIFGTLTSFGESVRLNIKILDIQRGVVIRSMIGNITRTADINKLLSDVSNPDQNFIDDSNPDPDPKPVASKDKNCGKTHSGNYIFINNTSQDVSISFNDGYHVTSSIVRSKNKENIEGIYVGDKGANAINFRLIHNIKDETKYVTPIMYVEECLTKTYTIK